MGKSLVITSGKGGVGKSTAAANLALALAEGGRKTVLIDANTGLRSLDVLLGMENRVVYDLSDLMEGVCRLRQALIRHPECEALSLIAASQLREGDSLPEEYLGEIVPALKEQFDWVIVDGASGVGQPFRASLAGADQALVVTLDDAISVRAAERVKALLREAGLPAPWLMVNRLRPEKPAKGEPPVWEAVSRRLELRLLGAVPEDDMIREAAQAGVPLAREGLSPAGSAFRRAARRLEGRELPVSPFHKQGALERLSRRPAARKG